MACGMLLDMKFNVGKKITELVRKNDIESQKKSSMFPKL